MLSKLAYAIPLWMCAAATVCADVTVRYEAKFNMNFPAGMPQGEQLNKTFHDQMSKIVGQPMRMKNGKSRCEMGPIVYILDYTTQQVTLIDNEHKTTAKMLQSELGERLFALMPKPKEPEMPKDLPEEVKKAIEAAQEAMKHPKTTVDSHKTGRTDTILGIQAEEREVVIVMEMPMPQGMPAMTTRMVMQIWMAKPEEALRNQAVREMTGYNIWQDRFMNPMAQMEKLIPNGAETFKTVYSEMTKEKTMLLRTHLATYMGGAGQSSDPQMEVSNELAEISSAAVDDALFQVPGDYQTVAPEDILKYMVAGLTKQ
jgi:hypothetical protein